MDAASGSAAGDAACPVTYQRDPSWSYDLAILTAFPRHPIAIEKGTSLDAPAVNRFRHILGLVQAVLDQRTRIVPEDPPPSG